LDRHRGDGRSRGAHVHAGLGPVNTNAIPR
jgi:hypothetical protein